MMNMNREQIAEEIAVIIPAYEPDGKLVRLCEELMNFGISRILVVDDGSGLTYENIFETIKKYDECHILRHEVNKGKGRALKDAFECVSDIWPQIRGVVTADSDGQHTPEDIYACMETVATHPEALVLGVRSFDSGDVPAKSLMGNRITSLVFRAGIGLKISDTQTGLRGIGRDFMEALTQVRGEKYEFETNMLIEAKFRDIPIIEVPIRTVYIEGNESSHFRPVRDSARIYLIIFKYLCSSGLGSIIDLALFTALCLWLKDVPLPVSYIYPATALARIVSATVNYYVNLKMVFATGVSVKDSIWKYALLAAIQLCISAFLVNMIYPHVGGLETLVKIPVDIVLFIVNYIVQREFVYKHK